MQRGEQTSSQAYIKTTLHSLRDPLVRYVCYISKKVRTITWEKFGIWTLLLCFNVTACCVGWRADDGRGKIGWQREEDGNK